MLDGQRLGDEVGPVFEFHDVALKQWTKGDAGFAGEFEVGRQSGVHDLAQGAAIILPDPLPKAQLFCPNDRGIVDDGKDTFGFVPGRGIQHFQYQGRVLPLGAKLHFYPHADLYLAHPFFGYSVGIGFGYSHGENDGDEGIAIRRGMKLRHGVTQIVLRGVR